MTPDVPLRTSDFFIEELLRKEGRGGRERGYTAYVDPASSAEAWRHRVRLGAEIRLLYVHRGAFGGFSWRALGEIEEQTAPPPYVSQQLGTHGKASRAALLDASQANLDRFLAKRSDWAGQVSPKALPVGAGPLRGGNHHPLPLRAGASRR